MADINTLDETIGTTTHNQLFSNILSSYYWHKVIDIPPKELKESSTLLDNMYTNIPDCYNTSNSGVLKLLTQSDHYPLFTLRKCEESPKAKHIL